MVDTTLAEARVREARQSLADRMGQLEDRVVGTIDDARGAVNRTVHTLTDTVTDVTGNVKGLVGSAGDSLGEALDFRKKVRENPVGSAAVAVGIGLVAWMLTRKQITSAIQPAVSGPPSPFAKIIDSFKQELIAVGQEAAVTASRMLKDKVHTIMEEPARPGSNSRFAMSHN